MATALDLAAVGRTTEPYEVRWTAEQGLLYALGVGAGQADALAELQLTTQNTLGHPQQVLPAFAVVLGQTGLGARLPFGSYERGALVHAEQSLAVNEPLPIDGAASVVATLDGIFDKGSGALVTMSLHARDVMDGHALWTSSLGYFIRGAGGFGGDRGPGTEWVEPDGTPDVIEVSTRMDQALLYRMNGDFNPLHSDPAFAKKAGFPRPILHGLCTYGIAGRVLAAHLCQGDQSRVRGIAARFSRPVFPGDRLSVQVWPGDSHALFRVLGPDGETVLDRGRFGHA